MKIRAGSEITIIDGKEYETPLNCGFFYSPNGSIMYLSGTGLKEYKDKEKGRYYSASVKNVVRDFIIELKYETVAKQMENMFIIRNVNGLEYHIPYIFLSEVDSLIGKFENRKENAKSIFIYRYQKFIKQRL